MSDWLGVVIFLAGIALMDWLVRADVRRIRRDSYEFQIGRRLRSIASFHDVPRSSSSVVETAGDAADVLFYDQDAPE